MDESAALQIRKTAYHEAAHAILDWNLGFGVRWIVVDRTTYGGKVMPQRSCRTRFERVGAAVGSVAGLAAQSLLQPRMESEDLARSRTDLRRCAGYLASHLNLTDGEQLALAITLTRQAVPLLHTPEVRKQLEKLVRPLIRDGRMFEAQVHSTLHRLPVSVAARRRCRSFVSSLEPTVEELIESAAGHYSDFRWESFDPLSEEAPAGRLD
jgi:hypothetical protein